MGSITLCSSKEAVMLRIILNYQDMLSAIEVMFTINKRQTIATVK